MRQGAVDRAFLDTGFSWCVTLERAGAGVGALISCGIGFQAIGHTFAARTAKRCFNGETAVEHTDDIALKSSKIIEINDKVRAKTDRGVADQGNARQ